MRAMAWTLALTLATITGARAETAYITDQLRIALRAEPAPDAAPITLLNSGAALEVLARDAGMVQVRTQTAEGWVDARYVVTQPPATAQLDQARAQLGELQLQLNRAQGALAEQAARTAELEAEPAPSPASPALSTHALLAVWGVSAAAMLGIGFLAGMARVRRNYRKRLGGMTLGI